MTEHLQQLKVEGAVCDGCVKTIEQTLLSINGVTKAQMDLATGMASVSGQANPDELIKALTEKGYPASVAA